MIGNDIQKAVALLENDELVAIPTETVYGLGGNALREKAIIKIFEVKNRPSFDPLIVHLGSFDQLNSLVAPLNDRAIALAQKFWPGPLTLLLPRLPVIPDLITAGSPIVGIRMPQHPVTRELLQQLSFPLAAPSANPFGYISPTTAQHVAAQLGGKIPYILDGGPSQVGLESTIIGFQEEEVVVFRKGGLSIESIEAVIGPLKIRPFSTSNPQAPGMLKSHYAPGTPLVVGTIPKLLAQFPGQKIGVLAFKKSYEGAAIRKQITLSETGDLGEAARNLFHAMRTLDQLDLDWILAEPVPEEGLGRAINDRLKRASAENK